MIRHVRENPVPSFLKLWFVGIERCNVEALSFASLTCGTCASQFSQNAGPRATLLATAPANLVEASPHDFFWGRGVDHSGCNHLGLLLARVRRELLNAEGVSPVAPSGRDLAAPTR